LRSISEMKFPSPIPEVKQCVDLESKVAEQEGKIRLLETRNLELEDSLQQKDTMLQALLNPEGGNKSERIMIDTTQNE
jgi:hypothetical protein